MNQVIVRTLSFDGDKLKGVRVNPGSNKQAFDKLGLQANDLVTAINGMQLNDKTRVDEVFKALSTDAEAQVTGVRRPGVVQREADLARRPVGHLHLGVEPAAGASLPVQASSPC